MRFFYVTGLLWKRQFKARTQEPVVRSKTRRRIVQEVTSNVKFLSPKIKNKKYREIALSKRDWVTIKDFFPKWFFCKKDEKSIFFEKKPCSFKLSPTIWNFLIFRLCNLTCDVTAYTIFIRVFERTSYRARKLLSSRWSPPVSGYNELGIVMHSPRLIVQ